MHISWITKNYFSFERNIHLLLYLKGTFAFNVYNCLRWVVETLPDLRLRSSTGPSPGCFSSALWGSGRTASQTQQRGLFLKGEKRKNSTLMQWKCKKVDMHFKTALIWTYALNVLPMSLPMTAKVPSRIPTADWIVGMPCNCLTGVLQFPLTLQGHTVTKEGREDGIHRGKFTQGVLTPWKQELWPSDKLGFV